jgi:GDP-L-fucose synthase
MPIDTKIFVAGHGGMVGSAIIRKLARRGITNIVTRTHRELDLTDQSEVKKFFELERPDQVFLAAAKVGGIHANNTYPAEFIYENLMLEANVIHQAYKVGVKKLLFLGSSCIYPKLAEQPMSEESLLNGYLEPTNEPYAIAKIAGIKLCESYNRQYGELSGLDYRSVMPTNLYGPGDNYHPENSHVIPALIRRFHEAKIGGDPSVVMWGSGAPLREFLFVDDLAAACVFVMEIDSDRYRESTESVSHLNIGSGLEISIEDLGKIIAQAVDYEGKIVFDKSKPDGAPRKLINSARINKLGWRAGTSLKQGLSITYKDYLDSKLQ